MNILNKLKKSQGLPLNTIVLAILVIIVLLVIIVFFTSKIGDTSKQLDQNAQIASCSTSNVAISSLGYTSANYEKSNNLGVCDSGSTKLSIIPVEKTADGSPTGRVCCASK